jgi:hypothetical protein
MSSLDAIEMGIKVKPDEGGERAEITGERGETC